jgi:cytochrome P450
VSEASNHLLVHLAADKSAFYRGSAPLFWSDQLNSWATANPAVMQSIQKDPAFHVLDQSGEVEKIRSRLHIDLPGIERALKNVPVNVEGEEHARRRRSMAQTVAARTDTALARFADLATEHCARHLGRSGTSELVADVFEPMTMGLARVLSGLPLAHNPDFLSPTQIFDKSLGLNRRKLVDAEIRRLWLEASRTMSEGETDEAIALAILGSDTILASLALSFVERVASEPGARLCDIEWGDRLTTTAVPFIERVASRDAEVAGAAIRRGDVVRLFLDGFVLEPVEKRDGYFGAGRHACLGRPVAQRRCASIACAIVPPTACFCSRARSG